MFLTFASWLHKTPLSLVFQHQVAWLWPMCETIHFAGLALLLGVAGMFDLRLLGFMKRVPISVVKEFMPWALVGFTLNLLTGMIFVISEPAQYFGNPTWWVKVAFLIVAAVNAFIFETAYGRRAAAIPAGEDTPMPLKIIAAVSLVAWLGVLVAGRFLPFVGAGVGAGL
jgi:hypothetical protein